MALTAAKVRDLEDKGFLDLYREHRELWDTKAREAYTYAKTLVAPTGERVRPDDALPLLVPGLVLVKEFRRFLDDNRLTQKYWRDYFAEFILDRVWADLEGGDDGESS
jgi:hypothetical protein